MAATFHFVQEGCPVGQWRLALKRQWGKATPLGEIPGAGVCRPIEPGMFGTEFLSGFVQFDVPAADVPGLMIPGIPSGGPVLVGMHPTAGELRPLGCAINPNLAASCSLNGAAGQVAALLATDPELGPVELTRLPS